MDANELHRLNPDARKQAIQDYLKDKGLTTPQAKLLTPEAILSRTAMGIWDSVLRNVARPLLKSIPTPDKYNPEGTQRILLDAFKGRFNSMSKEELVMLVSIMHMEEMEKQMDQMVRAGLVGPDMDKPDKT